MPAKAILTLLFLASLCVVVVLGIRALPHTVYGATATPKNEILVAAAALPPGTLLRAKDVVWEPFAGTPEPSQILRPLGAAINPDSAHDQRTSAEVFGAALRKSAIPGEPIIRGAIVKPGDRDFLQVVLSARARAIAIPVTTGGASTGILYPGDWVDVILTQTFKNEPPLARRSVGETVVENLRVLAIDPVDAKPSGQANGFGRAVTLEVTPEQAERINVAAELGKLSLTLRSIGGDDANATTTSGAANPAANVKPIWAGDVSPSLVEVPSPSKVIAAGAPPVEVIHGTKAVAVKPD